MPAGATVASNHLHECPASSQADCSHFFYRQVLDKNGDRGAANLAAQQAAQAAQKAAESARQNGQSEAASIDAAKKAGQEAADKVCTSV